MDQPNESSPEFSPSILQNKKGPMNPSFHPLNTSDPNRSVKGPFYQLITDKFGALMADRRALALVCLLLPPLAVFYKSGFSRKFGLSLILAFFVFPGKFVMILRI